MASRCGSEPSGLPELCRAHMSCPVLCSIAAVSSDGYCLQHSEHPAPEHSGWYVPVEDVCCVWVVGCTRSRAATPVLWGLKSSKGQRSTLNESISQPRVSTPIFELHPQLITHSFIWGRFANAEWQRFYRAPPKCRCSVCAAPPGWDLGLGGAVCSLTITSVFPMQW